MKVKYLALIALSICVVTLACAAFMHSWYGRAESHGRSGGWGLISGRDCSSFSGDCENVLYRAESEEFFFVWAGRTAFVATLIAAVMAAFATSLLSRRQPRELRALAMPLAISVAMVVLFAWQAPVGGLGFGRAFYIYGTGILAGVAGQVLAIRVFVENSSVQPYTSPLAQEQKPIQPVDRSPESDDAAKRSAAVPACPKCRAPTIWMAKHKRYLCKECNLYV